LKEAVAEDPSHHDAWAALFERALKQGEVSLATRALEQTALTAQSASERARRWGQLGTLLQGGDLSNVQLDEEETDQVSRATERLRQPAEATAVREVSAEDAAVKDRWLSAIEEGPLDPRGYAGLSALLRKVGDAKRARHVESVADALLGKAGAQATTSVPRTVADSERPGLRHPMLRTEDGELMALCAPILLALTQKASGAFPGSPFRRDAGPGAEAVTRALDAVEQVLAMRFAHVRISDEPYPAFRLLASKGLRVEIGRQALAAPQPEGRLRFEGGKALFSQSPELLVLLHLGADALHSMLQTLERTLRSGRRLPLDAQRLFTKLGERRQKRLLWLLRSRQEALDVRTLKRAARFSAHRAGLAASGDVAASLAALRALGAGEDEQAQLVRFAVSERYFQMRRGAV
jgi:hypothetical protein